MIHQVAISFAHIFVLTKLVQLLETSLMNLAVPDFAYQIGHIEEMICEFDSYSEELQSQVDHVCTCLKDHIAQYVAESKGSLIENVDASISKYSERFEKQHEMAEKLIVAFDQIKSILSTLGLESDLVNECEQ